MLKIIALFFMLFTAISARENPFSSSTAQKNTPITSNEKVDKPLLQKTDVQLSQQARVIKKVTIEYINLDGSTQKKSVDFDHAIDWHLPIVISQHGVSSSTNTQTVVTHTPIQPKQTAQHVVKKIDENGSKTIKKHVVSETKKEPSKKPVEIKHSKDITFIAKERELKILSKDESTRDFTLTEPNRIIIDFEKNGDVKNNSIKFQNSVFKEVKVGNHEDFYRAVIELDGSYAYKLEKVANGYSLILK